MQRLHMGNRIQKGELAIKRRIQLVKITCLILMCAGAIFLVLSIIYNFQTLAFIGISLTLWGALLLYVKPDEYTRKILLDAVMVPSLESIDQIIGELGYQGKPIYLPPEYLKDSRTYKIYIPKRKKYKFPGPEIILKKEQNLFVKNPEGMLLTPPGAELTKLFEKRLKIDFEKTNLQYLKQNLPKLFTTDLEIAENMEIQIEPNESSTEKSGKHYGIIKIKVTKSIFHDTYKKTPQLSKVYKAMGPPTFSAIACALTKVTGEPLFIEDIKTSEDGKTIVATYKIENLEYTEQVEAPLPKAMDTLASPQLLSKLPSLILIILGSLTLIWVSQLAHYEMFVWNKSLDTILFVSRAGEPIDLGLGMRVIYYYLISLTLLTAGIILYLPRSTKIIKSQIPPHLWPKITSLILIILGSLTLIWVSQLASFEMFVWNKSLDTILFVSRAGEPIDLGLGMRVIYYYLISLALLAAGIILYLQKKRGEK